MRHPGEKALDVGERRGSSVGSVRAAGLGHSFVPTGCCVLGRRCVGCRPVPFWGYSGDRPTRSIDPRPYAIMILYFSTGAVPTGREAECPSGALLAELPCATTLSSLDAPAVVTRRRRRVTSFAFPSGGAPTGASLHLDRLPLQRRRPRRRVCRLRRLRPALPPPLRPCAPRRATGLPTPIATTAAPARVPPGPGRQHVGPDHRLMW